MRLAIVVGLLYIQPLPATEYSDPDEQGIHTDQVTLISQTVDDATTYRACLLAEAEFHCYQLDSSNVEACAFEGNKLVCTSPTRSSTLEMLDEVIKQNADGAK